MTKKMRIWLFLGIMLLTLAMVEAATLKGTVYDIDLTPVTNVIVEIDTTPKQRMVAKDGNYEFLIPKGEYRIKATADQPDGTMLVTTEILTIKDEGAYIFDLFLFPDLEEEDEILQDIDADVTEGLVEEEKKSRWVLYVVIIGIFIIVLVIFFKLLPLIKRRPAKTKTEKEREAAEEKKQEEKSEGELVKGDLDKVIEIIKKHDGRVTQKDLRKELPVSEAKVSLMITELEHQGKIKKIKKGR